MNRKMAVLMFVFVAAVFGVALALGLSGSQSAANGCNPSGVRTMHLAIIRDGKVSNDSITAPRCDMLTITNKDDMPRDIAFGVHDKHVAYDGISERILRKDESLTITLNKSGEYHWHDHLHDEVQGYFTVTE